MGCDIHFYVEVKEVQPCSAMVSAQGSSWEHTQKNIVTDEDGCIDVPYDKSYYYHRCYSLFAMLANVRNSYGIVPISMPKGMPEDVSASVQIILDNDDYIHSHSWLTLRELIEYDWTQIVPVADRWCTDTPYHSCDGGFLDKVLLRLIRLGTPDNVRIVFWFDN